MFFQLRAISRTIHYSQRNRPICCCSPGERRIRQQLDRLAMGHNEEIRVHSRWSTALECFSTPAVSLKRLLTGKGMRTNSEGEEGLTKKKKKL